jgi:DNA-binding beta-propeller fold protein YncE
VLHVSSAGRVRTVATCEDCRGIFVSWDGSAKFVADAGNATIRRVEVATGAVTTLAGSSEEGDADGVGGAAQFSEPYSLAVSLDGSALFVGDCGNNKIGGWRWRRVL